MLALIPDARLTMVVQDLMSGIICIFVAWASGDAGVSAFALIAEFFIAFDLPSIVFADHIMSEQFFQLMLVLAMVPPLLIVSGVFRDSKVLAVTIFSAAMAGGAILVRPIGILIPFLTPLPFLFAAVPRRTRIATVLIAFAIPMLTIVGWSARNYAVRGYFGLSWGASINLYFFRAHKWSRARREPGCCRPRMRWAAGSGSASMASMTPTSNHLRSRGGWTRSPRKSCWPIRWKLSR